MYEKLPYPGRLCDDSCGSAGFALMDLAGCSHHQYLARRDACVNIVMLPGGTGQIYMPKPMAPIMHRLSHRFHGIGKRGDDASLATVPPAARRVSV